LLDASTAAGPAGLTLGGETLDNAPMKIQPRGFRPVQQRLINQVSERLCTRVMRVQRADLKLLAGGDLRALLHDLGDELRSELHRRRASRASVLVRRSAIA
jgi:hypothetical protein